MPANSYIQRWFNRQADRARHALTLAQEEPDSFRLKMLMIVDRFTPNWVVLRNLGRSRTIRSAYFWILFVPICAKFLRPLPSTIEVPILGSIEPALPFSWIVFFWMAIVFSAATLLFFLRCPPNVKSFATYKDFAEEKHGELQLHLDFYRTFHLREAGRWGIRPYQRYFKQIGNFSGAAASEDDLFSQLLDRCQFDLIYNVRIHQANHPDAFTFLRLYASHLRPWSRLACVILYAIGFALSVVLLAQNILSVIEMSR